MLFSATLTLHPLTDVSICSLLLNLGRLVTQAEVKLTGFLGLVIKS